MIEKIFGKKVADCIIATLMIITIIGLPILILSASQSADIPNYNAFNESGEQND